MPIPVSRTETLRLPGLQRSGHFYNPTRRRVMKRVADQVSQRPADFPAVNQQRINLQVRASTERHLLLPRPRGEAFQGVGNQVAEGARLALQLEPARVKLCQFE